MQRSIEQVTGELTDKLRELSIEERRSAVTQLNEELKKEGVVGPLSQPTRDLLWRVVVGAFAAVLVLGFGTLAIGVFVSLPDDGVKPEIILAMFTSVVGFLAGLFVSSPTDK